MSDGKITVCPPTSPNGANCATNVREAEADCPSGYFCVNGDAKSVKWQDASGKGICKISNQLDPKEGSEVVKYRKNLLDIRSWEGVRVVFG